ncbi:maternal protein tudor [Prorops nasuta]|uniref:maternal protein tudor n=1 Tax=Prorops nasuta TaxID=863751 RepID=UPI0034D00EEC
MALPQNKEFVIFVTHIEEENSFLKIWGQTDKTAATFVERTIFPYIEHFALSAGCTGINVRNIPLNTMCCAKFQNDGYYRAKILNILPDNTVLLHFIDYGNIAKVSPEDVFLLDNFPNTEELQMHPAVAFDFVLANVIPINKTWDEKILNSIRNTITYNEYKALLYSESNDYRFIKISCNGEDFGDMLVKQNMAIPATLQEMFRLKSMIQQPLRKPYVSSNKLLTNAYLLSEASSFQGNLQGSWQNPNFVASAQSPPLPPVQSVQPIIQEALVFKSRVLDIGSTHEVYISFVEDGPLKFSIQLQSNKDILSNLMKEINKHPTQQLKEPPLPGSVCLGRYTIDKVLCRAVVMAVTENKCKVYYVDFGHTEILPYSDIFELPAIYIKPRVLSIRFTLSGIRDINITDEMKNYFKRMVSGKLLLLHVCSPEGPPLIQYGDLYENGINIKDILKKAFPAPPIIHYEPPVQLQKGSQEIVHVSFVNSCSSFYVQLSSQVKSLENIMTSLAEFCKTAPSLNQVQAVKGLPCSALYESHWYRAKILSISGEKAHIIYVDFGNEENVPVSSLRLIRNDLVTSLREQAIKCVWNGYESKFTEQGYNDQFEALVLEKFFHVKIVEINSEGIIVDLLEPESMEDVKSMLIRSMSEGSPSNQNQNGHINTSPESFSSPQSKNEKSTWKNKNCSEKPNLRRDNYDERTSPPGRFERNDTSFSGGNKFRNNKFDRTSSHDQEDTTASYKGRRNDDYSHSRQDSNKPHSSRDFNNRSNYNEFNSSRGGQRGYNSEPRKYNDYKSNKAGLDKSFSDKDSDTSNKSNKSFGKSPRSNQRGRPKKDNLPGRNHPLNFASKYLKFNKRNENGEVSRYRDNRDNFDGGSLNIDTWNTNSKSDALQIPSLNINLRSTKTCEVVFANGPKEFFVQMHPEYLELEQIMESINAAYSNEGEILQNSGNLVNTLCIAQYSVDLRWYRAKINSLSGNSATVFFVDYGNSETINFDKIKVLQPQFATLPMQAIHCKLFGMRQNQSPEDLNNFFELTDGKQLDVEFVKKEKDVFEVAIREIIDGLPSTNFINERFCDATDFAQLKESANNSKVFTNQVSTAEYVSASTKWTTAIYDLESKAEVIVTWFTNPKNFYCHITNRLNEFKELMNDIQCFYVGKSSINTVLEVGSPVIAIFAEDGALYRGEIVEINKGNGHVVRYIDFGNCAVVERNKMYPVEKRFTLLPKQAIHCGLKDIQPINNYGWPKPSTHAFDAYFNCDKYELIFHKMKDDKYEVTLFGNGKDIAKQLLENHLALLTDASVIEDEGLAKEGQVPLSTESVSINPLPVTSTEHVIISYAENTQSIWLQRISDYNTETELLKQLVDYYSFSGTPLSLCSKDSLCAAKSSDGNWYRGKIIECTPSTAYVNFIDYGNTEEINTDSLKVLERQFYETHQLAVNVRLNASVPGTNEEQVAILQSHLSGKDLVAHFIKKDNNWLVELIMDNGENFSTKYPSSELITSAPVITKSAPEEMTIGHKYSVIASHVDSPNQFWLQRLDEAQDLDEAQEKLQSEVLGYPIVDGILEDGTLCCAVYSIDKLWYRAEVLDADADITTVRFIDYGNTDVIDNSPDNIRQIMHDPKDIRYYATKCKLDVITVDNNDWDEKVCERFRDLVNSAESLEAMINVDGNPKRVELFIEGKAISDILVDEKLALRIRNEEVVIDEIVETELDPHSAFISHLQSPDEFWVQEEKFVGDLEIMSDRFMVAEMFPKLEQIEVGKLCVAKYPEDDNWYRAKIVSILDGQIEVLYIDYGNSAISTELREIPSDLADTAPLSRKCCLRKPEGIQMWSDEACKEFFKLAAAGVTVFLLDVIQDGDISLVELTLPEGNVAVILANLCERCNPIINTEERLPPLGEETSLQEVNNDVTSLKSNENSHTESTSQEEVKLKEKQFDSNDKSSEKSETESNSLDSDAAEKINKKLEHFLNDIGNLEDGETNEAKEETNATSYSQTLPPTNIILELSIEDIVERMVQNANNDLEQQTYAEKSHIEISDNKIVENSSKISSIDKSSNESQNKSTNIDSNTVKASTPKHSEIVASQKEMTDSVSKDGNQAEL